MKETFWEVSGSVAIVIGIIVLVILLVAAGYLAASETALMRVSRIRVRYLVEKKVNKAEKLEKLIEDPDKFLPALLLMVLVVQLTSASLATWLTTRLTHNAGIGVLVGTAVVTVFMFVFGELVPKAAASHESERIALGVTGAVTVLARILRPVAVVFEWTAVGLLKLVGRDTGVVDLLVSEEGEIKAIVTAAEEQDVIEEEEKDMIHSVFEFSDTVVREVMVPRPDMDVLPSTATIRDALLLVVEHGYSRIPVYGESIDRIVGVLYAKDLLQHLQQGKVEERIEGLLREAFFVPETQVLSKLLKELQKRKVHMAIVVDEYGSVVGLVTIEDLVEEIVGEIFDEYDRELDLVEKIEEGRYRVDARLNIDDLNEILFTDLPKEEDVDTVGGLVLKVLGHVPVPGETFEYNGVRIKVERVRENRIYKVQMEILDTKSGDVGS